MRAASPITGEHDISELSAYRRPRARRKTARKAVSISGWLLIAFAGLLLGVRDAHQAKHHHPPSAATKGR